VVKQKLVKSNQTIDLIVKQGKGGNKLPFKVTQEASVRIYDSNRYLILNLSQSTYGNYLTALFK
jgi:hypothetical protein